MRRSDPQRTDLPRRVLGYARVSGQAQGQHGTSLEGQDEEQRRFCRDRGYPKPVMFVEVESGGEGKEEQRTEQLRLMAAVQPGDLVLCCKQDRWSRYTLHYLKSVEEIMGRGGRFFSIAEQFDPSTASGKYASTIMAATAEHELQRIRDRTVGSRQRLRLQGAFVEGLPPFGYRVEDRKLVVEPKAAAVVRRIFALTIEGKSTRQIVAVVGREHPGTPGLDPAGIARRIKDRRYLGEVNTIGDRKAGPRGEWMKAHEPIVDRATWARAQTATAKRKIGGRPASGAARNAGFLLRGIAHCGQCGRVLVAHHPGPRASITHGGYYLCRRRASKETEGRCTGPLARHVDVDAQMERELLAQVERLAERLSKPAKAAVRAPARHDYEEERRRLLQRRERLVDAIAEGILSGAAAKTKIGAVETALLQLDRKRAEQEAPPAPKVDRSALLGQVQQIWRAWPRMTVEAKRETIGLLAEKVELHSTSEKPWARGAWRLQVTWRKVE